MSEDWLIELRARWQAALSLRGRCPHCGSKRVWHNGIRRRKVTLWEGGRAVFIADVPVRRLRCGACLGRWSRGPERVVTRGLYQPCVVAAAVMAHVLERGVRQRERAQRYGCHRRTLERWVARVAGLCDPGLLARELAAQAQSPELPPPPGPGRPRRSAALQALGQRAVWVLGLLEALASLAGLTPPGLAHAACLMPALVSPSAGAL
jgi:transposase-like protein